MRRLLLLALLPLCACRPADRQPEEGTMTAEEVAEQLASVEIEPGQWEYVTEIVSAEGPIPDAVLQQMTSQRSTAERCITPEEAARPSANFLEALEDSSCAYRDFRMQGTRVSGAMQCTGGPMGDREVALSGNYGSESFDMNMAIESGALPGITIRARARGSRIGDCP